MDHAFLLAQYLHTRQSVRLERKEGEKWVTLACYLMHGQLLLSLLSS